MLGGWPCTCSGWGMSRQQSSRQLCCGMFQRRVRCHQQERPRSGAGSSGSCWCCCHRRGGRWSQAGCRACRARLRGSGCGRGWDSVSVAARGSSCGPGCCIEACRIVTADHADTGLAHFFAAVLSIRVPGSLLPSGGDVGQAAAAAAAAALDEACVKMLRCSSCCTSMLVSVAGAAAGATDLKRPNYSTTSHHITPQRTHWQGGSEGA